MGPRAAEQGHRVTSGDRIVLDTDAASLSFKRQLPASLFAKIVGSQPLITWVTYGEMTRWPHARSWGNPRRDALDGWLRNITALPGTSGVARKWGEIVAYADRRGHPRPVNDSWIAAACLAYDLPLATLNVADFQDFAEYEGLRVITP